MIEFQVGVRAASVVCVEIITKHNYSEPHVGLEVCMKAYRNVPAHMQERLAAFTDGKTRLIGGSSDTMYIPGRHVANFKQVLGLFLETDCFFEIATPSTLHLVVPLNEPILFVDHVRLPLAAVYI
jgi:hypothetical protein